MKQIQEDLPQEKEDNAVEPEKKKEALKAILADYNTRYGSNHSISDFDLYYQDVQKRIKDQQWPNADHPHSQKIDITIVVDMLLTGFDSKYLNTLYVDKNLKHHGLIQAFSRTNRVRWRAESVLRFLSPLIKPDVQISRIRLSDWLHHKAHDGDTLRTQFSCSGPSPIPKVLVSNHESGLSLTLDAHV